MADYKSMYYHLAGRTAVAVDVLDSTIMIMESNAKVLIASSEAMLAASQSMLSAVEALDGLKEKLKLAQQTTEDMFIESDDEDDASV